MIKRIVKLSFHKENIEEFLSIFENSKYKISAFEGCHHLELWRCQQPDYVFFTYSFWDNQAALDAYRHSALFQETWRKTKALFNDKPEAWSVELETLVKDFTQQKN